MWQQESEATGGSQCTHSQEASRRNAGAQQLPLFFSLFSLYPRQQDGATHLRGASSLFRYMPQACPEICPGDSKDSQVDDKDTTGIVLNGQP